MSIGGFSPHVAEVRTPRSRIGKHQAFIIADMRAIFASSARYQPVDMQGSIVLAVSGPAVALNSARPRAGIHVLEMISYEAILSLGTPPLQRRLRGIAFIDVLVTATGAEVSKSQTNVIGRRDEAEHRGGSGRTPPSHRRCLY